MKRSKALGRGLDALIPPEQEGTLFLCPIDSIVPHPSQPRQHFDEAKLGELVQTIKEKGVLTPVIVRSYGSTYQLVSGERRWRAAKLAGLKEIPAILREVSDREALELSLIENIQREDLTPLEEARAYQALMSLYGVTQEELARRLGKDRSTIANSLRLLKLPPEAQSALERGEITAGHARCILSVAPELQPKLLKWIITKGLSVRAAEEAARKLSASPLARSKKKAELPPDLAWIRDRLRSSLSTKVEIRHGKRKGAIVIEYYGLRDLERILKLLGTSS
jgi:ParB family chromosome partitioning protein